MIVTDDGYSIEFYPNNNKIVIVLPQTLKTLTSTAAMISNRREDLSNEEMMALLAILRAFMEEKK